jgi:carboxyl-terminal processing protease
MGLDLRVIEHRVVVTNVHADTPAAAAHVQRGWIVQRVDGADPMEHQDEHAPSGPMARYARDAAAQALDLGSAGSTETWTFLDASGTTHTLSLQRAETSGTPTQIGLLPTFRVRCEDRMLSADELQQLGLDPKLRIAVIGFNIWMPVIATQFDEAVDRHRDCDGIILDLRGNPGGVGAMAMGIAGHFHDDTDSLGTMRTREASLEFKVNPRRSTADGRSVQPFTGPLAILVDPMSASTSEIFAAGLQSLGRAHVVGRTSAGAALPAQMRIIGSPAHTPRGGMQPWWHPTSTRVPGAHERGVPSTCQPQLRPVPSVAPVHASVGSIETPASAPAYSTASPSVRARARWPTTPSRSASKAASGGW